MAISSTLIVKNVLKFVRVFFFHSSTKHGNKIVNFRILNTAARKEILTLVGVGLTDIEIGFIFSHLQSGLRIRIRIKPSRKIGIIPGLWTCVAYQSIICYLIFRLICRKSLNKIFCNGRCFYEPLCPSVSPFVILIKSQFLASKRCIWSTFLFISTKFA